MLDRLDLEVPAGRSVAIMGRSGAGKTSLLSCILGLTKPDRGSVQVDGLVVRPGRFGMAARIRREKFGVVFQGGELLAELTPAENVMLAGLLAGSEPGKVQEHASELLETMGVPASVKYTGDLSGGERQRVAVARSLMNRPAVLLADEPTGSLDEETRDQVADFLFGVCQQYGCALVVATHDRSVAARADQTLLLVEGSLHPVDARS